MIRNLLRLSCALTLIGLGLCLWALLVPEPIPVVVSMSVAQVIGTVAFAIYLLVLFIDLRVKKTLERNVP